MFLERKIISRLHSEVVRHMEYLNGYDALLSSINRYGADHEFTKLVPTVKDVDPDDAFSSVPYEKGRLALHCSFKPRDKGKALYIQLKYNGYQL